MKYIDVTSQVETGSVDDEHMPITRCVCGATFPAWERIISIYDNPDWITPCPKCGRRFFFQPSVKVYELCGDDEEAGAEGANL